MAERRENAKPVPRACAREIAALQMRAISALVYGFAVVDARARCSVQHTATKLAFKCFKRLKNYKNTREESEGPEPPGRA